MLIRTDPKWPPKFLPPFQSHFRKQKGRINAARAAPSKGSLAPGVSAALSLDHGHHAGRGSACGAPGRALSTVFTGRLPAHQNCCAQRGARRQVALSRESHAVCGGGGSRRTLSAPPTPRKPATRNDQRGSPKLLICLYQLKKKAPEGGQEGREVNGPRTPLRLLGMFPLAFVLPRAARSAGVGQGSTAPGSTRP